MNTQYLKDESFWFVNHTSDFYKNKLQRTMRLNSYNEAILESQRLKQLGEQILGIVRVDITLTNELIEFD